jgi:hypothetical protein
MSTHPKRTDLTKNDLVTFRGIKEIFISREYPFTQYLCFPVLCFGHQKFEYSPNLDFAVHAT